MFSRKFATALKSSLATIKQDRATAHTPAVVAITQALQALHDEAERTGPVISISETGSSIEISCGLARIVMKVDGSIELRGVDITIRGSGELDIEASGHVTVKGSTVDIN